MRVHIPAGLSVSLTPSRLRLHAISRERRLSWGTFKRSELGEKERGRHARINLDRVSREIERIGRHVRGFLGYSYSTPIRCDIFNSYRDGGRR